MNTMPPDVEAYKRTPEFNETTIPKGLLKSHSTKAGVWAKIIILEGNLRYTINQPQITEHILNVTTPGIIEPEIMHHIEPIGTVRLVVEFYR